MQLERSARHHIPSLDGVRALAISLVVAGHFNMLLHARGLGGSPLVTPLAELGVQVFFVLSGFLITSILLAEMDRTGGIDLPRFYFRRTLRIFPAFWAFMLLVVLAASLGVVHWAYGNALAAAGYLGDFVDPGAWVTGHSWSLAVEEQFYLLWPAALVLLGRRRGMVAAGAVLLLAPLVRTLVYALFYRHSIVELQFQLEARADALAAGCLLAGYRWRLHQIPAYRRLLASRAFPVIPAAALLIAAGLGTGGLRLVAGVLIGSSVVNLCLALSLDRVMTYPHGPAGGVLNARPAVALGLISYSLYLWQEPFVDPGGHAWFNNPALCIPLALLAAVASYTLVERPFLRLRPRLEARWFGERGMAPPQPALVAPATQPGPSHGTEETSRAVDEGMVLAQPHTR